MKLAVASLCVVAMMCCGVTSQPTKTPPTVWDQLQENIDDIFDRNQGRKAPTNINDIAEKLRLRIMDAINNISEAKVKDIDSVIEHEIKDIDDTFGLSDFFKKVSKAIDANIDFKNTGNNRLVYFF
ncbi:hypothetical protein ElyMa_006716100 [Elysia marginata]|uniref:Uncharacterized protein n=1 Tax=Elysia marginata TaxID=1093978 RepID=A0AAV4IRL7_9GAST|nr:hypothetical protein ElyMa_006716100 [Elysia marginata]